MLFSKINRFSKLRRKRFKFLNHLNFLLKCKNQNVIPKFIVLKCSVGSSYRVSKALNRSRILILRSVIQDVRQTLSKIEEELYDLHLFLSKHFAPFSEFENENWFRLSNFNVSHQSKLNVKFNALSNKNSSSSKCPILPVTSENHIVNLSSHSLSSDQKNVLELGLNFSQSCKPSLPNLIAPIESSFKFSRISSSQKDTLRHLLADAISCNKLKNSPNLSFSQRNALRELKSNSDIVISKADKGGQIVLLDKENYIEKANALLCDGPYIEVKKFSSNSLLSNVKKAVNSSVILNDYTKRSVVPSLANVARFYALPKIHKPGVPLRPIVSNIGTATYPLAKFLAASFSPLCNSNVHTIKNSYEFVNKLRNLSPVNCSMLSLDVKSLFTNVPVAGALSCLESRLREFHYSDIEVKELVELTKLCVQNTVFEFNGKFYKQSDGLAMGNPLSPILCDIYMHYFEVKLFSKLNFKCWLRYVDDTFILIENPFDVSFVLSTVNSIDPSIQFTAELENSNQLPFLDVLVTRCDNDFKTCVYRKPFSVSLPPHALSNHPANQKAAAFYTYVYRALKICSDPVSLANELNYLKSIACKRGFSPFIVDKALKKFKQPPVNSTLSRDRKPSFDNSVVLPFYPPVCFNLAKILKRFNFRVIFKPVNKFNFPSSKSPIPDFRKFGIYNIPCNNCDKSYIGQTKRALEVRLKEHSRYVTNQEISKSSVAKHSWEMGHTFNFKDSTIIFSANSVSELDFFENLAIFVNRDKIVNDNCESNYLSSAWKNLFRKV